MFINCVFRLTFVSMAVMIYIIITNFIYFIRTDHFLEECTSSIYYEEKYLLHYPCLYLDLWRKYNNGNVYDTRHFLNAFFGISTILAIGFVISCLCLLISISRHCHVSMIPWCVVNILIAAFLSFLMFSELFLKPRQQYLSKYFLIAASMSFYCVLNFIWGVILYTQMKKSNEKKRLNDCERFEYLELNTLHNPNDNLSWF